MIDISFERHPELYQDFKACLRLLQSIDEASYRYPEGITNFHLYSEIRNPQELLSVKSFFATQNLEKCRLILWSDYDITDNELLRPFAEHIDFRVYDAVAEAAGTILEGKTDYLLAHDTKHYLKSGILRFLCPHKMGGIWFDMDMVLLRDLVPILDQEFAYMWGSETDFAGFGPCAAFMNIHKGSEHSRICLEEILKTPIVPDSVCFDHALLAKVYRRRPFTVFPSAFFDTEWQINVMYPGLGTDIESGWFVKNRFSSQYLFLEAFAWHWHNSGKKDIIPQPGSKFNLLERFIDGKLAGRNLI